MIILSEALDQASPLVGSDDLNVMTGMAKLFGFPVYPILAEGDEGKTAEVALSQVPRQSRETEAIWLGYTPTAERYRAIEQIALQKNIRLVNSLEQHLRVQEFDRAYSQLVGLTPESLIVTELSQCEEAIDRLGLPVFAKGTQSHLKRGFRAKVVHSLEELQQLATVLLSTETPCVMVRQFVNLRHSRTASNGMPLGREYRVLIYQQHILTYGYFWQGNDPLQYLSVEEEDSLLDLALKAASRLDVSYVAIDIGQLEDESWTIIETADAQFSGVGQVPLLQLWSRLQAIKNP